MSDVALTLIKSDDGIFLIKRRFKPFANYWSFPGGTKKSSEPIEITAIRETKEETGLDIEIIKNLDNFVGKGDNSRTTNLHIFLCKTTSQEYVIDKEECLDGGWFDIKYALQEMQVIPQLKKYLDKEVRWD